MLTDPSFLYRLYRAAIQRAEVDTIFSRHFGGRLTASLPDFRTYLIAEHRDKRLNEVIYPPISMDGTERIALESHNRLLPGKCTSLIFPQNTLTVLSVQAPSQGKCPRMSTSVFYSRQTICHFLCIKHLSSTRIH